MRRYGKPLLNRHYPTKINILSGSPSGENSQLVCVSVNGSQETLSAPLTTILKQLSILVLTANFCSELSRSLTVVSTFMRRVQAPAPRSVIS